MPPKVSVVMPVYNGERFLREAIESILGQTLGDFEFLIVDDASTDASGAILAEYAARDSRITVSRHPVNTGQAVGLNTLLARAQCEYVAVLNQDDVSLPDRLAQQVRFLDDHPDIGVAGSWFVLIDGDGHVTSDVVQFPTAPSHVAWCLYFYDPLAHPAVMMRRGLALQAGGYVSADVPGEDYSLWCRLRWMTKLANVDSLLLRLRKHGANDSLLHEDRGLEVCVRVLQNLVRRTLGRSVPVEIIRGLYSREYPSARVAFGVATLINELAMAAQADVKLSAGEKANIRADAAERMRLPFRSLPADRWSWRRWHTLRWIRRLSVGSADAELALSAPQPLAAQTGYLPMGATPETNDMPTAFDGDPYPGRPKILFVGVPYSSHVLSWLKLFEGQPINVRLFGVPDGAPPAECPVKTYLITPWPPRNLDGDVRQCLHPTPEEREQSAGKVLTPRATSPEAWLAQIIREWQPDIIHTLGFDPGGRFYFDVRQVYPMGDIALWVHTLYGGSDIELRRLNPEAAAWLTALIKECDQFLSDVAVNREYLLALGAAEAQWSPLNPVPATGGLDLEPIVAAWHGPPSSRRIILWPKAYDCPWSVALPVFEALKLAWDRIQPCTIHMLAMTTEGTRMWYYALPQSIQQRAYVYERIPQAAVLDLMVQARVMLAPSLVDGFPNSVYEAMAAGALPIVSPLNAITRMIAAGENALFARNLYPEEIAEALVRAMNDDALVDEVAQRNLALVQQRANRARIRPRVLDYYEDLATMYRQSERFELAQRTQALDQREAALNQQAEAQNAPETGLEQRGAALDRHEADLQQREVELRQAHGQLDQRVADLEQRDAALGLRVADLDQRAADLQQRDAALSQRVADLDQRAADLQQRDAALSQRVADLDQRAADLQQRDAALSQRAADLQQRETDFQSATIVRGLNWLRRLGGGRRIQ
jgi:glycosyltransferase involved in cell wall biosynthesis